MHTYVIVKTCSPNVNILLLTNNHMSAVRIINHNFIKEPCLELPIVFLGNAKIIYNIIFIHFFITVISKACKFVSLVNLVRGTINWPYSEFILIWFYCTELWCLYGFFIPILLCIRQDNLRMWLYIICWLLKWVNWM